MSYDAKERRPPRARTRDVFHAKVLLALKDLCLDHGFTAYHGIDLIAAEIPGSTQAQVFAAVEQLRDRGYVVTLDRGKDLCATFASTADWMGL